MGESCGECRFSAAVNRGRSLGKLDCRRYPPVDIARHDADEWPRVYPEAWCGEFQPKAVAKPARKRPATGDVERRGEQG